MFSPLITNLHPHTPHITYASSLTHDTSHMHAPTSFARLQTDKDLFEIAEQIIEVPPRIVLFIFHLH